MDPEASDNFNIGVILAPVDGLTMTVDYYNMSLSGPFGRESGTCACADKVTNAAGQINKIITELINGDDVDTDGIDVEVNYSTSIDSGLISAGANANYILMTFLESLMLPAHKRAEHMRQPAYGI